MKKFIMTVFMTTFAFSTSLTAHAAEALDRDYIETEIWEEMWNGKDDNGLDYPEASYKHHLLEMWLDENYSSDDYDWSEIGELKYEYKDYYRHLIEDWDFEDDENGNWSIDTEDNHYSFYILNGTWQMIDQNGDTVDTFLPFSTLEEDETDTTNDYKINDDGEDSPRVVGKVTNETETASDGLINGDGNDTAVGETKTSDGDSERSGINSLVIVAGAAVVIGAGAAGCYIMKKKK